MTAPQSSAAAQGSLLRDVLYAARYYLRNRWTLVALAGLAIAFGLYFGGWGWLVAAGLAPIVLSTLPCLIMCGLGVCMMCRGQQQSTVSRDAADTGTSAAAFDPAPTKMLSVGGASCCHGGSVEDQAPEMKQVQSKQAVKDQPADVKQVQLEERSNSHA